MLRRRTAASLVAHAPAKLNLYLRVVGKRTDGFHEIETVMTTVDLYDTLIFSPVQDQQISLDVQMAGPRGKESLSPIPTGSENLVVRAAELLKQHAGVDYGVSMTLIKRIPSAAGLGGGSSDAAAALGALSEFWSIGLPNDDLVALAGQLGSDVPFFLGPASAAICRGRGERIEPLFLTQGATYVIAKPESGLSTPAVYRQCRPEPEREGCAPLCDALHGGRFDVAAHYLRNDLQSPATELNCDVLQLSCLFDEQNVWGHQLSGSGTAYFGVCASRRHGMAVAARLRSQGVPWVCVVQSRC